MAAVWDHSRAQGVARLVLLALADHADHEGYCWPSVETVAQKCRVSERTVQRAIAEAEASGEIQRRVMQGRGYTNLYRVMSGVVDSVDELSTRGDTQSPPGVTHSRQKVTETAKKGDTQSPRTIKNRKEPRVSSANGFPPVDTQPPRMPDPVDPDKLREEMAAIRRAMEHPEQAKARWAEADAESQRPDELAKGMP
jgi:DNA-binding transcriptional MocR family regulator